MESMSSSSSRSRTDHHDNLGVPPSAIIKPQQRSSSSHKKGIVVFSDVIRDLPVVEEEFSLPCSLYETIKNCSKSRIGLSLEKKLRDSEKWMKSENGGFFVGESERRKYKESVNGERSEKRSRAENGWFVSSSERKSRELESSEGEFRAQKVVFVFGGAKKDDEEKKKKMEDEKKKKEKEDMMVMSIADELAAVSGSDGMNLRPRKPKSYKKLIETGGVLEQKGYDESEKVRTTECRKGGEKSEKPRKFCLMLTKEEIMMDYIAIMGVKPPKKLKKRPRAVQKALDRMYPCTEFGMITPEMYEVHEKRQKR